MRDSPSSSARNAEAGWFGDTRVDPEAKTGLVGDVFRRVAGRYDLMNDLMSVGIHRAWKDQFADLVRPRAGERIVDVAGGTGDIAFRLHDRAPEAAILICDLTAPMVAVGRDRAIDRGITGGLAGGVGFVCGNAEALPLPTASLDAYTIAFGLRNVSQIDTALAEAARVLKPGGRFYCLEFSKVVLAPLARAYDAYSRAVIPRLGALVARDRDSYAYLVESIRRFPDQASLARRMEAAGLKRARWRNLTAGIVAIHSGWRL
jgi:demethylmenaquinone methyltransferase/2-methoxy-6-polyprenyl-1,4-benzoquinol methylase